MRFRMIFIVFLGEIFGVGVGRELGMVGGWSCELETENGTLWA